jgi:hypothetical protein
LTERSCHSARIAKRVSSVASMTRSLWTWFWYDSGGSIRTL